MPPAIKTLPLYGRVSADVAAARRVHLRGERGESGGRGIVFFGRVQVGAGRILSAFDQHRAVEIKQQRRGRQRARLVEAAGLASPCR